MSEQTTDVTPESFELDHNLVVAPYVRVAHEGTLKGGGIIVKYDVRFTQPNKQFLEMPAVHSVEHLLATTFRQVTPYVVDISPMGCQTGFYVATDGDGITSYDEFLQILTSALELALAADSVPGATEVQCGWAASHTLEGAKATITEFLNAKSEWTTVFND